MAEVLSSDDLDAIGADALASDDPLPFASELVDAVERGRLADAGDTSYALSLAAEITESAGDLAGALGLSSRAVEAADEQATNRSWLRAVRAGQLIRFGRVDDGLAELRSLRPRLTRDPDAGSYVIDALVDSGWGELAEQWLTPAVVTALERRERLAPHPGSEEYLSAAAIAFFLVRRRHHLRRDLELPHDEYDDLANRLLDAVEDVLSEGEGVMFWPRAEFDRLLAQRPESAEHLGHTWEEHRDRIERDLQAGAEAGRPTATLEIGTPALLAAVLEDDDAADGSDDGPTPRLVDWPPTRNELCWCGSGPKYKKCCLPRGRERRSREEP